MNVVLLNAAWWPLAVLVGVPILVHLFARSRPPAYRFSSVDFILRIVRKTMRLKRPQDWLLLVLRVLLVILLLLVFLRPLFFPSRSLSGPLVRKNVVLIVDATASMGYGEGAQTRFAAACAEASEVLSGLTGRDTANIVWLDAVPSAVFPQMGVDMSYLQSALRRAEVSYGAGDIEGAFHLASSLVEGSEGRGEIYVVSDFQRAAWQQADAAVDPAANVVCLRIGDGPGDNGAVTGLQMQPTEPLAGEDATVFVEVSNFSDRPRRRTVYLSIGTARLSRDVMVPAWDRRVLGFQHRFPTPGRIPVVARLDEDRFTADDSRNAWVPVAAALRVGIAGADRPEGRYWSRALRALPWTRVEEIDLSAAESGEAYDAVFAAGWAGEGAEFLQDSRSNGTTVVCYPSRELDPEHLYLLAESGRRPAVSHLAWVEQGPPVRTRIGEESDPVFDLFAGGEFGDPAGVEVRGRFDLPGELTAPGTTVLAYSDGVPALVRYRGSGTFLLWNVPLEPTRSAWARKMEFVPFLGELVLSSRTRRHGAGLQPDALPGDALSWHVGRELLLPDVTLQYRDGEELDFRATQSDDGVHLVSTGATRPGLLTWSYEARPQAFAAVHFPVVESDLRTLDRAEIERRSVAVLSAGRAARRLRDGIQLWPLLLSVAAAWAFLEAGVQVWAGRS